MIAPFDSFRSYFRFSMAKSFYNTQDRKIFDYPKNLIEKIGDLLTKPVFLITDFMLRNIRNPLMILAVTVAAVALASLVFYPTIFLSTVGAAIPAVFLIQAWMLKLAVFSIIEMNILGIGLRTLGRLMNSDIMEAYKRKEIIPLAVGTEIITM